MIRDRAAYERLRVAEEHRALRELDMTSSIEMAESLLTSSLMDHVDRRDDLILFKVLAGRDKDLVDAVGVARRHLPALDRRYLHEAIKAVGELAEDLAPLRHLDEVLRKASSEPS